ncbi:MAG: hypothetical protein WBE86_00545 [Candidatus Acidiferrales bacterium]
MADAIKTGTTPGSLQFQREPWTPFYVAGEIIRESRKYAGDRSMAYLDKVTDHHNHRAEGSRVTHMTQRTEYKLVSGDDGEINKVLTTEWTQGWKPILLSSVVTGQVVRSQVILERAIKSEN